MPIGTGLFDSPRHDAVDVGVFEFAAVVGTGLTGGHTSPVFAARPGSIVRVGAVACAVQSENSCAVEQLPPVALPSAYAVPLAPDFQKMQSWQLSSPVSAPAPASAGAARRR